MAVKLIQAAQRRWRAVNVPVRARTHRSAAATTLPANVEVVTGDLRTKPRTRSSSNRIQWRCSTPILSGSSRPPGSKPSRRGPWGATIGAGVHHRYGVRHPRIGAAIVSPAGRRSRHCVYGRSSAIGLTFATVRHSQQPSLN